MTRAILLRCLPIVAALSLGVSCRQTAPQPLRPAAVQPTALEAANAAILAEPLAVHTAYDLTDPEAGSFEGADPRFSSRHFRDGRKSLMWAWNQPGATLEFHQPIAYRGRHRPVGTSMDRRSVFGAWIYSEEARPDATLRISFHDGESGGEACWFHYGLNFTGWRQIAYKYDLMNGAPSPEMSIIRISTDQPVGMLFFDEITPVTYQDIRWQWPDYQTPELAEKAPRIPNSLWINRPEMQALSQKPLTPAQRADIQRLKSAVLDSVRLPEWSQAAQERVLDYFADYQITRDDLSIRGKAVDSKDMRAFLEHYFQLAALCRVAPEAEAQTLEQTFLLLTAHLLDQGWAEGSALNAQHHFGYKSRSWAPAVLLMEEPLRRAGLLEPTVMAIIWMGRDFTDFTAPFEALPRETQSALSGRLADYLNTFANTHLTSLLLLPDSQAKHACLTQYTAFLDAVILAPNGSMKADGSFYHHGMHYAGYGLPALRAFISVVGKIDGSAFEISPEAYAKLKHSLYATYVWGYPGYAFSAFGRHPMGGTINGMKPTFITLAQSAPGTDAVDRDLAQIVAAVWGETLIPDIATDRPAGYWSLNYHAGGTLKHGDYSVMMKGYHNRGVRSHETYKKDNRFGRYGSHGSVVVFQADSPNHSGLVQNGWDWSKVPGATTLLLPHDVLEGKANAFYGWSPPQSVPFSGSGNLGTRAGAFGFQIDGQTHEQSLQARKSVHAIGDLLVCLGSDIANSSAQYHTITTLVQNSLDRATTEPRSSWDGAYSHATDVSETKSGPGWLIDITGTGYVLPQGQSPLWLTLGEQASLHNKSKEPTSGRFFAAWLDHGRAPTDARYTYVMLLGATPARLDALAAQPASSYRVIRQDRVCHAVSFPEHRVTSYVFFHVPEGSPPPAESAAFPLAVDRPAIVITRDEAATIALSVTQPLPAIKRPFDESPPSETIEVCLAATVSLVRSSRPAEIQASADGGTILTIEVLDGAATELILQRR